MRSARPSLPGLLPGIGHINVWLAGALIIAIAAAVVAGLAIYVSVGLVVEAVGARGPLDERLPRIAVGGVIVLPLLFYIASILLQRRGEGRTFYQQASNNRLASGVLMLALVGLLASIGAIIGTAATFEAEAGLLGAGLGGVAGLLALLVARFSGGTLVTLSVRAHDLSSEGYGPLTRGEQQVRNIVHEMALAAGIARPRLSVVEEESINAFAVGHSPSEGHIVVTRGLLERLDREQQQGVIGHEMAHLRNLDSRYGLYVVVVIGLVAMITDGFLRIVIEGWKSGAFFKGAQLSDDVRGRSAGLVAGILFGLLLLGVATLLRVFAPLFALALQASVRREREFLADATAVELTRNPVALERALASIQHDSLPLSARNRGLQNLWFENPDKPGSDGRPGIFATHPSIGSRIERLRLLRGEPAMMAAAADDAEARRALRLARHRPQRRPRDPNRPR